jgi:hypothetical protein
MAIGLDWNGDGIIDERIGGGARPYCRVDLDALPLLWR